MKKFIRYLYEYQNGRRVQNVGFVKVEEADDFAVLQIYGKGFPAADGQSLEILVFFQEYGGAGKRCVGIPMGKVAGVRPMFGYRLEYTIADVGSRDVFRDIGGVILLSEGNGATKWYGAIWDERSVNIEQMVRQGELEESLEPEERQEPEEAQEMEPSQEPEEEQMLEEVQGTEESRVPEESEDLEEEQESEEEQEPEENQISETEESVEEMPVQEEALDSEMDRDAERTESQAVETVIPCNENKEIHKITRQDIVRLSRREWKLANNNFLLHGCHNYHHLISFEKDGKCWIGVPGIYHPNEQRAAMAFGFDHFMRPEEGEIELLAEEKNETEDFGYWCRTVSTVI